MPTWLKSDPATHELVEQWASEIQEGDVIRTRSGSLRIVRAVHRYPPAKGKGSGAATRARRTFCFFAIRHCSWTGAGYTCYNVAEMAGMGWLPTAARPRELKADIDLKLRRDFESRGRQDRCVKCCEAVGLP